jgi:hypothetical protein
VFLKILGLQGKVPDASAGNTGKNCDKIEDVTTSDE